MRDKKQILREKITILTSSFGIKGYDNVALWTYINDLIEEEKEDER